AGPDDPRLEADMAEAARAAAAFAARHRGRLATIAAGELARALVEYETIEELGRRPSFYASLLFAADTASEAARRLVERTREAWIDVVNELTAFEIEIKELSDERYAALVADPALASARHWMDDLRRLRPHTLSEAEERLINEKNLAGRDAFVRLFDELTSSLRFRVEVDGAVRTLTGEETLALLHQPDAQLRERAHTAFLETHAEHGLVLASIFNAILYDHRLECELRRYADPATPTHLENEVRPATVEAMMAATEGHYPLAQRYFRLKAGLLGVPRLKTSDVYAPLATTSAAVSFEEARRLVLDAFAGFSPRVAALAEEFFARRWIDAAVRPGKRLGAFCASLGPRTNPWVLLSFTDTPRDVSTLAHELGHGIHDRLAGRQRALDFQPPLVLAETASTFAEMLVMRRLLAAETRPEVRRAIIAAKIDDTVGTVF